MIKVMWFVKRADHLTLEEFRELTADLAAVREKWWGRGREPRDGTRAVRWITHTFPRSRS